MEYDKISFGIIMLGTIKANVTVKLERKLFNFSQLDTSNPRTYNNLTRLNPFVRSFGSIQDANIQLNELVWLEGFFSQTRLVANLRSHYNDQGRRQILKVVGSSNMLGNPVGMFNKIGVGFIELRREPRIGMRQGTAGFVKGVGRGLGGMVKGVVGGSFDSLSSFQGSLYAVIQESTWGEDTRQDVATNVGSGMYYGVKGFGMELYKGVGGAFTKPYHGSTKGGMRGFGRGVGKGLVGLVVSPVTATLRLGHSITQGISGSANQLGNLGKTKMELMDTKKVRARPARRIDVRNQIKIYDEDMAIVSQLLKSVNKGVFSSQQIRFYAVVPTISEQGLVVPNKKGLIVITNAYLIYMKIFSFLDLLN